MSDFSFIPIAEKILNAVMKHPASRPFSIPLIPGENCPDDYHKVIKKPIDLTTIKKNLKAKRYKNIDEWYQAVNKIWDNTRTYYGADDIVSVICDEIEAIFENEYRALFLADNVKEWWEEVNTLREKINNLNNNPPKEMLYRLAGIDPTKKICSQLFTDRDVRLFIEAVKLLKSHKDHEKLINVVVESQPELATESRNVDIDIYKLNPATFVAARDFVRNTLEEAGIPYPKKWT
ncbi:Bromodomain containing protein [Tritrichomonas foetus]|uniref:Bromodomain containing protein n=1 Tax=Tritrichomonas foetus TaxID=1144522 RepID=A0A1J4JLE9_9EUKA|nr:Bromodomain containing protein [Tritrichomonas foetus]|eukprot:OHS99936.1 Bromodomain containing protein [Tritrichomonas foetus]